MEVALEKGRCAVVAIDLQRVFTDPQGPHRNSGAEELLRSVNELLSCGRRAGLPVIHSRYVLRDDLRDAGLLRAADFVEEGHLSSSSKWVELDPRLDVEPADVDCVRARPSAFYASDLDAVLRGLAVDQIVLSGLSLNNAIAATARDAFARDIPVLVPRECCDTAPFESDEDTEASLRALGRWTAEVADLENVCARLAGIA